jgi:Na+-driven multidrug efflux pump
MGTYALAVNQIVIQILSISFMPGFGFGKAATTMVSAYMGAGDIMNARRSAYISMVMTLCIMLSISASFILIPHLYIRIFSSDGTMLNLGKQVLLIAAISEAFNASGLVFSGALFGAGDSRFVMWLILAGGWGLFIPSTYFLGVTMNMGIVGAWICLAFYTLVWGILCSVRFVGKKWERIKI